MSSAFSFSAYEEHKEHLFTSLPSSLSNNLGHAMFATCHTVSLSKLGQTVKSLLILIVDNATDQASELGVNNQLDLHSSAPLAFIQAFKKIPFKGCH